MGRFRQASRAAAEKLVFALLLILALPMFGGGTPPRNWGQCPAVITVGTTQVVYALGDTHGDYDRLVKLLVAGKLIAAVPVSPEQVTWSGGRSILVVTGDMIDKWDHLENGVDQDGYSATVLLGNRRH